MVKRIREYIKYTRKELEEYTRTKGSCVNKVNNLIHIGLPPHGLGNLCESILGIIAHQKIGFYDTKLQGIILDVKNIKVLGYTGTIRADDPVIHLNINSDCYVFQPKIGAVIRGVVKHISTSGSCLIGVIIYRVFSVSIKLKDHVKKNIEINSEIEFRIKDFDLQSAMPFIEGELIAKQEDFHQPNTINLFDEEENVISDSDAESEDLFGSQQSTQIDLSQRSKQRERHLSEEIQARSVEYVNVIETDSDREEHDVISGENRKKTKKSPKQSPKKLLKPTEDIENSVKEEETISEITSSKKIKRERTISKTISLGTSVDNLLLKFEIEEQEFLNSQATQVEEKNVTELEESLKSEQVQSREISCQNPVYETILETVELHKNNKKPEKDQANIHNYIEVKSEIESEIGDNESSKTRNKKTKKRSQKINDSIQNLLETIKTKKPNGQIFNDSKSINPATNEPEKNRSNDEQFAGNYEEQHQQKEQNSVILENGQSVSDLESIMSSNKPATSKKKKNKNKLNDSLLNILTTIKNEKSNSPQNKQINCNYDSDQRHNSFSELQNDAAQVNGDSKSTTASEKSNTVKKKKNKNKLDESLFNIMSTIDNINLNSSNNEKEIENNSNKIKIKKTDRKKKTNSKGSLNDCIMNILNEVKIETSDVERNDINTYVSQKVTARKEKQSKKLKHTSSPTLNDSMQSILETITNDKIDVTPVGGNPKRKRKNSLIDSMSQIVDKLSSDVVNERTQGETLSNSFSSPLLSSTMINPRKRSKN